MEQDGAWVLSNAGRGKVSYMEWLSRRWGIPPGRAGGKAPTGTGFRSDLCSGPQLENNCEPKPFSLYVLHLPHHPKEANGVERERKGMQLGRREKVRVGRTGVVGSLARQLMATERARFLGRRNFNEWQIYIRNHKD